MSFTSQSGMEDISAFQVHSRREIIKLLHAMQERGQLVSMQAGADSAVTSVLEVDEDSGLVVIDRAPSKLVNQRILESDNISFETVLDNIRVLFYADKIGECLYEGQPALYIATPVRMVRLQRREHYRVPTPVASPLHCTIQLPPDSEGNGGMAVVVSLKDISGGGIGAIDEKKLLDDTTGRIYSNCRIDLPGVGPLACALQVRNSLEVALGSGKSIRKLGFMFVDLPHAMVAAVQRYITRLERERNAKATGMN